VDLVKEPKVVFTYSHTERKSENASKTCYTDPTWIINLNVQGVMGTRLCRKLFVTFLCPHLNDGNNWSLVSLYWHFHNQDLLIMLYKRWSCQHTYTVNIAHKHVLPLTCFGLLSMLLVMTNSPTSRGPSL